MRGRNNTAIMPELPEVETIVRGLAGRLRGLEVEAVHLARSDVLHGSPTVFCAALRRRRVARVWRVAKQIRLTLAGPGRRDAGTLVFHLGMSGRLLLVAGGRPVEPHTHLRLVFRGGTELRFVDPRRFGGVWFLAPGRSDDRTWLGRNLPQVGQDALRMPLKAFRELLRRRRQIKALLLDQRPMAGLGNIYCDEALHRAGIHPLRRACTLNDDEVRRLHAAIRRVLQAAVRAGGSSIGDYRAADGSLGRFQLRHRVYGREGRPCPRCRTAIVRIAAAGRSSYLCSRCQPGG